MKNINKEKSKSKIKSCFAKKQFKYGSLSAIFIAVFISIVFLVNIVASILINRYNLQIDLSYNQIYDISDQTKSFLKDYQKQTKIILLDKEDSLKNNSPYSIQIYNVAKNIAAQSESIKLEFVDLDENPNFASTYSNLSITTGGILVVDNENNAQFLSPSSMFSQSYNNMGQTTQVTSNVESSIAHALEFISGQNPVRTAVINGHSELDISSISKYLEDNGYKLNNINLITNGIPDETELIMINSPTVDYTDEDIQKLTAYLNKGGALVYFASSTQPSLPNLESLLKSYGIAFTSGTVIETSTNNIAGNSMLSFYAFADEYNEYTENISNDKLPIIVNACRPMHIEQVNDLNLQTDIFQTSDTCALWPSDDPNFDYHSAKKSSFALAIGAQKKVNDQKTTKVTAFSNIQMLAAIDTPTYGNGELILSAFGETADHKSKITILPKSMSYPPLGINMTQAAIIGFLFIAVIPIAIAIVGFVVCYRRKRR